MVIHCIHLHILVLETKTFKLSHMVWFLGQELDFEDHCRALPTQYILWFRSFEEPKQLILETQSWLHV